MRIYRCVHTCVRAFVLALLHACTGMCVGMRIGLCIDICIVFCIVQRSTHSLWPAMRMLMDSICYIVMHRAHDSCVKFCVGASMLVCVCASTNASSSCYDDLNGVRAIMLGVTNTFVSWPFSATTDSGLAFSSSSWRTTCKLTGCVSLIPRCHSCPPPSPHHFYRQPTPLLQTAHTTFTGINTTLSFMLSPFHLHISTAHW